MDTKALRQKVLDLAIRGKLVPQDPNDEPASVLLEKIRTKKQQMVKEGKLKAKDIKNDTIIFKGEDSLHYEKFQDGSVKCIEDEIPFDLPDGWAWERLSNIAAFSGGKTPSTSRREFWDGEVLWVTSKDMKSKYITSSQLRLSTLGAEQMQIYQPNTLLLVRHTLPVAILKKSATVNQDLKAIVLYMPELSEYIYVCLKGMEAQLLLKYTKSACMTQGHTSARNYISTYMIFYFMSEAKPILIGARSFFNRLHLAHTWQKSGNDTTAPSERPPVNAKISGSSFRLTYRKAAALIYSKPPLWGVVIDC